MKFAKGFTLIELMVGIAVMGIMLTIAVPSFSEWVVKMRVDNEISSMHRLILTARNSAVNSGLPVIVCPLDGKDCTDTWSNQVSAFIDANDNDQYDVATDTIIRVKDAVNTGDNLEYPSDSLIYRPTGRAGNTGTFVYCPKGHSDKNRSITTSTFGRAYASSDTDGDGKDEKRDGSEPSC